MRSPKFWQRLLAAELAPAKNRVLLEELGSFVDDPLSKLIGHPLLGDGDKRRLETADMEALEKALASGVSVLEYDDFPELLFEGGNVSPALFIKGSAECLYAPTVAIVGTRNASPYGRACAFKFANTLAKAGVTVVSGGALGIDAAAHKGALEAGGKTAAVLASGVDTVYPAVHSGLFRQIADSGCLVSQFALSSRMAEYKFLIRNILIACLSQAVLVIEAPARSGALSTATAANELGREVFVVPANIDHTGFQGSFGLLRDGASIVTHPEHLLEALGLEMAPAVDAEPPTDSASAILAVLSSDPVSTERIVELTGMPTSEVLSELTMLELDGRVMRAGAGYALIP